MGMKYEDITEKIIGAAYVVHGKLGWGFLEKVYQNALMIELKKAGLNANAEAPIQVFYEGEMIGAYIADMVVEDKVLVELKAVKMLNEAHEAQLVNYLKATGVEVGLLINFGNSVKNLG